MTGVQTCALPISIIAFAKSNAGSKLAVSGFHDATGSLEKTQEVAKSRAIAVRAALTATGISDDRVEMKKPEQTQGGGDNAEARRVEVSIVKYAG